MTYPVLRLRFYQEYLPSRAEGEAFFAKPVVEGRSAQREE
jgi:hypothetical protein